MFNEWASDFRYIGTRTMLQDVREIENKQVRYTVMEQATDWTETAAIDGLVSSWSGNLFVSFCLRATGYGLSLVMRPRSSSRGRNTSASLTVTFSWYASAGRTTDGRPLSW